MQASTVVDDLLPPLAAAVPARPSQHRTAGSLPKRPCLRRFPPDPRHLPAVPKHQQPDRSAVPAREPVFRTRPGVAAAGSGQHVGQGPAQLPVHLLSEQPPEAAGLLPPSQRLTNR